MYAFTCNVFFSAENMSQADGLSSRRSAASEIASCVPDHVRPFEQKQSGGMPAMQSIDGRGGQDRAGSKRDWIDRLRMPRLRVRDKCALAAEGAQSQSGAGMSVAGESRHT
jgi:hypothetical protein